jgi:hypothetical protein
MPLRSSLIFVGLLLAIRSAGAGTTPARVEVVRTPDGGIQPQAVVDPKGVIHLVYYKGDPGHGDLFYVRREPGREEFTSPIRVNSEPGSAIAMGTIRGGQIALGRGGVVHIAWNGSTPTFKDPAPMLYSRLTAGGSGFEPQRNLMKATTALDGGGTVAADDAGRVYVAWHGRGRSDPEGESHRKLWIARSTDDGATFATERPAFAQATGACPCCGTKALVDAKGTAYVLYRAAPNSTDRDLFLLSSRDGGDHFDGRPVHPWKINACPMSSASLADAPGGPVAAWETAGQVYFSHVAAAGDPIPAPGRSGDRKHPAVAVAPDGSILLAWTEGTGWQKGGALAWQIFDASGRPTEIKGHVDRGIPVWSLPTVVTRPDGGFTIVR